MSAGEQLWENPWLRAKLLTHRRLWTANYAARKGALIVFKELGDELPGYSNYTMDWAAEHGRLDVVQWLYKNRRAEYSKFAMHVAAKNGHLDVVKWLHANSIEGGNTHAIDWAAGNGHLDVVKWLHANTSYGCTYWAMNWAAQYGHLDVAQWLHANISEMQERRVLFGAALHTTTTLGRNDVVNWIRILLQN